MKVKWCIAIAVVGFFILSAAFQTGMTKETQILKKELQEYEKEYKKDRYAIRIGYKLVYGEWKITEYLGGGMESGNINRGCVAVRRTL